MIFADFAIIFADFSTLGLSPPLLSLNPTRHGLPHLLFKGIAERTVLLETTLRSQLLSGERLFYSHGLAIKANEMVDAQIVDIGIIGHSLSREILAEIEAVGTHGGGELVNSQVVLQIELRVDAMLL